MVDIKTIFSFVVDNPITALITGGIIFLFLACIFHAVSPGSGGLPLVIGILLLGLGVGLYIMRLEKE